MSRQLMVISHASSHFFLNRLLFSFRDPHGSGKLSPPTPSHTFHPLGHNSGVGRYLRKNVGLAMNGTESQSYQWLKQDQSLFLCHIKLKLVQWLCSVESPGGPSTFYHVALPFLKCCSRLCGLRIAYNQESSHVSSSLGAKHQNCTQYLSLLSYWLKLRHMAMLAAREDGKYRLFFFQAFMCLDKILLLEKKGIEDMRGQPSSLFQACGLDYFRSSCFGLVSRKTGAHSPPGCTVY